MATPKQDKTAAKDMEAGKQAPPAPVAKAKTVTPCNFRWAGRLSNEMARSVTAIGETFARYFGTALDDQLGAGIKVKLQSLDQLPIKDYISGIPSFSYVAALAVPSIPSNMLLECDVALVFPIIDLLLGGTGTSGADARELSEIEDEIMQDLVALIARQAENAWRMPSMSMTTTPPVKASGLHQYCPPNEKVIVIKLEMELSGVNGFVRLAFPTSFVNVQIKQFSVDQPQKKTRLRYFPTQNIRERILDCEVIVSADLTNMRIPVKDLIKLQPGCILKLRTPVRTPGMLTVGGREIFEALPVRNGKQKAAQLGGRVQLKGWGKA